MPNLRFGYINVADAMALTANPVAMATAPVTYLQSDARTYIFKATSTASQEIKGTSATAYTISQMCLWRHNLLYNDTIRLYLYSDTAWTTNVYDSTALAAYESGLFANWGWAFTNRYFTPVSGVKSFKIVVAASAAAMECARLFLGAYVEAPINAGYGYSPGRDTNSKQSRSEGASLNTDRKGDWRTAAFDMTVENEADYAIWDEIGRYCGTWGSIVSSLSPGAGGTLERNGTLFAKFEKHPGQKLADQNRYDFSMKLLEL
jgi:hypothetical protein